MRAYQLIENDYNDEIQLADADAFFIPGNKSIIWWYNHWKAEGLSPDQLREIILDNDYDVMHILRAKLRKGNIDTVVANLLFLGKINAQFEELDDVIFELLFSEFDDDVYVNKTYNLSTLDTKRVLDNNKDEFMKSLLLIVKISDVNDYEETVLEKIAWLRGYNINWPELGVIEKSIRSEMQRLS